MTYPSLAGKGTGEKIFVEENVFSDIKLDGLLSATALDFMSRLGSTEDVLLRQEVFGYILKNGDSFFKEALEILNRIKKLDIRLSSSESESEKNAVYLYICEGIVNFYSLCADSEINGELGESFKKYYCDIISDEKYKNAASEIGSLTTESKKTLSITSTLRGASAEIKSASAESYLDKLRECAKKLGVGSGERGRANYLPDGGLFEGLDRLYPELFEKLGKFRSIYSDFYSRDILDYIAQFEFYTGVFSLLKKASENGIPYVFPSICAEKTISFKDAYDITLLIKETSAIVPNDILLDDLDSFFFLTGANGGGKTTYLRALCVNVLLACCGSPVFASFGKTYLPDGIFTHFPKDEGFINMGRNAEESGRVDEILSKAKESSLILLNETFSTASEEKSSAQTKELANKIKSCGALGIYVTHQISPDETPIPFLNVIVDPLDSNRRTYKVARRGDGGGSFAKDILKKYGLTKEQLEERKV